MIALIHKARNLLNQKGYKHKAKYCVCCFRTLEYGHSRACLIQDLERILTVMELGNGALTKKKTAITKT